MRNSNLTNSLIPTCNARTHGTGSPCKNFVAKEGDKCWKHGAGTKKNRGGRPLSSGKSSKYPTETLKEREEKLEVDLVSKGLTKKEKSELEKYGLLDEIENAKNNPAIRDFGTYIAFGYVLLEHIKKELDTLPGLIDMEGGVPILPDLFLVRIGALIDLITKALEREAKYKYSERYVLTIDEIRGLFSQILYGMRQVCGDCSKRDELAVVVNQAVVRMKEEMK